MKEKYFTFIPSQRQHANNGSETFVGYKKESYDPESGKGDGRTWIMFRQRSLGSRHSVKCNGLGNFSNEGDISDNGKNAKGIDWQNNNSARASRFFVHFFPVTARLRRENA